jgi:hypothetical protein
VFDSLGSCVIVCAGKGVIGVRGSRAGPGVAGGGGGLSSPAGRLVLMTKAKVAPLPGTPLADMSPPCSWAS